MGRPAKTLSTGQRFGRLVILDRSLERKDATYRCLCDCGNVTRATSFNLRNERTQSCGCLGRERRLASVTKHGLTPSDPKRWHPLYRRWLNMKTRCYNDKSPSFKNYGARGIYVCKRWRDDFTAFLDDMGMPPSPRHTLERKNNNGPYSPKNVVWALPEIQHRNRSDNVKLTYLGQTYTVSEWAKLTGIQVGTLSARVRAGWSAIETLTTRPRYGNRVK